MMLLALTRRPLRAERYLARKLPASCVSLADARACRPSLLLILTVALIQDSWLLIRGMKTLQARMEMSEKGARRLAQWLTEQPDIDVVYYPGLPNHPGREIHEKQSLGYGLSSHLMLALVRMRRNC